jgi:hypothetical protein
MPAWIVVLAFILAQSGEVQTADSLMLSLRGNAVHGAGERNKKYKSIRV